jgi:hypothetical protein
VERNGVNQAGYRRLQGVIVQVKWLIRATVYAGSGSRNAWGDVVVERFTATGSHRGDLELDPAAGLREGHRCVVVSLLSVDANTPFGGVSAVGHIWLIAQAVRLWIGRGFLPRARPSAVLDRACVPSWGRRFSPLVRLGRRWYVCYASHALAGSSVGGLARGQR